MIRKTLLRAVAAVLPLLVLSTLLSPPTTAANVSVSADTVDDALAGVAGVMSDPGFARLAPTLAASPAGGLTAATTSLGDLALLRRINAVVSSPAVTAVANDLTSAGAAGTRNHADYWDHYYRAQQHAGYAVGGAAAIGNVWTVLVVPGVQRCGTDANCAAFWVLIGVNLTAAGASYTAFEGVAAATQLAAFAQSAGYIGYRLITWVVVCVYAGQMCDQPPI